MFDYILQEIGGIVKLHRFLFLSIINRFYVLGKNPVKYSPRLTYNVFVFFIFEG